MPWVPETFLARFPVLSSLYSDPRENSHCTLEKPLVPRVLFQSDVKKIKGHLNKRCQCQAKPQFVSEESFSWKLKFAISSKRTFHKHYSEWTSNIKLFHVLKVVAWILVSNKTVSLRTSLRRTLISKSQRNTWLIIRSFSHQNSLKPQYTVKKSCPVNSVTDCFFHKSCLLSFADYKTRRDTPYNRLYEDTPPGRKGCFFHPRVMSKVSNLESEAYRKRAKEKRIFYTECFLYLVLFLLDKKTTITIPPFLAGNSPFWPWA